MPTKFSRREMLKLAGLSAAAAVSPVLTGCAAGATDTRSIDATSNAAVGRVPRNVVFMVADGMSAGVLSLADNFSRAARGPEHTTHWTAVMQDHASYQGMVETHSLDSIVTDSAAAASAWGSGSRVNNGQLNILPNAKPITPLAKLVQNSGRSVGLVTTCTITHATPAGFAVTVKARDNEDEIAEQYHNHVDVLLGGGSRFFAVDSRKDKLDLQARYQKSGYALWNHRDQLLESMRTTPEAKILGTFAPDHLPFTIDQQQSPELLASVPTLAEMTQAALHSLAARSRNSSSRSKGFFLMVEGGKVDHCAHVNDAAGALWDQLAFDDAIGVALKFAQQNPDTLIVLTTDHGNANPGINGIKGPMGTSNQGLERLTQFTASTYAMMDQFKSHGRAITPEQVTKIVSAATKIEIDPAYADALAKVLKRESIGELSRQLSSPVGALGQILGNYTGVGWTGGSHTSDYATLTAIGPGAEHFAGFGKNTDAFKHITGFFGIDHVNPTMSPDENWRSAANKPVYQHAPEVEVLA